MKKLWDGLCAHSNRKIIYLLHKILPPFISLYILLLILSLSFICTLLQQIEGCINNNSLFLTCYRFLNCGNFFPHPWLMISIFMWVILYCWMWILLFLCDFWSSISEFFYVDRVRNWAYLCKVLTFSLDLAKSMIHGKLFWWRIQMEKFLLSFWFRFLVSHLFWFMLGIQVVKFQP